MDYNVKHSGLWIFLIVLLGLALRLSAYFQGGAFAYFAFGDEILAYDRAVDYAQGIDEARYLSQAKFTTRSYTPGSLWTVFWMNVMRLGGGPQAVAGVMMVLNVCALVFVYQLGCRLLGVRGGLWAALFMATQPWAVYYAVGAYNPEIMAFFGGLTLLALWTAVTEERSPQIFWVGFLPILSLQFHVSALALFCGAVVALGLTRRRLHWGAFWLGVLCGLLLYWPYLQGDGANGWANTRLMFAGDAGKHSFGCLKAITTPFSLLMSWCKRWTLPDFADYLAMGNAVCGSYIVMFAFKTLGTLVALVFIFGFLREAVGVWRNAGYNSRTAFTRDPGIVLVAVFLVVPLAIFLMSLTNYSSRYAIFQLPILMMIPAIYLARCAPRMRYAALFRWAVIVTIVFNVYFLFAFFAYQGRLIAGEAKFVPSFRRLAVVYDALKADAGARRPIAVVDCDFSAAHRQHDALAIAMYVRAREKEARLRESTNGLSPLVIYDLMEAAVPAPTNRVAYRTADIKLVRRAGND